MFLPYALTGCTWAAMLALPFTLVTNALEGRSHMGTYLGLFNCAICLPQIIAGLLNVIVVSLMGSQLNMLFVCCACLIAGAISVSIIKSKQ